ncbi:uncharacterized protein V1477_006213 [Vespula maculifrons]|uniref:Uncharacterized protein n=1 Tax=Vespula maculifrons TaxID=7453 RepID=A0ABD2CJT1_VESMC
MYLNLRRKGKELSNARYNQSLREAQYSIPAFTQKLYCDSSCRKENNVYYYHHPIYEDEISNTASYSIYSPLSALTSCEMMENYSISDYDYRSLYANSQIRTDTDLTYSRNYSHRNIPNDNVRYFEKLQYNVEEYYMSTRMAPVEEKYMTDVIAPLNLDLNTYGHLKIDYTDIADVSSSISSSFSISVTITFGIFDIFNPGHLKF